MLDIMASLLYKLLLSSVKRMVRYAQCSNVNPSLATETCTTVNKISQTVSSFELEQSHTNNKSKLEFYKLK